MRDITIREAGPGDHDHWKSLRKVLWPNCPDEKHSSEIRQILSSAGIVLIAEHSEEGIIGFAEVSLRSDHVEGTSMSPVPYLEGWFVDGRFRRKGIGGDLIERATDWALQNGYCELASDSELTNEESIQCHSHLGFKEVGRTVHFLKSIKQ